MKISWDTTFKDLEGKEVLHKPEEELTLKKMAVTALCQMVQQDQQMDGEEKFKLGLLANKISLDPNGEFEVEEVALIKKRIGFLYGPLLVFQAYNALK